MNKKTDTSASHVALRSSSRFHCLRDITLTYEGQNDYTIVKAPDLSARGMFVSTPRRFHEGAILNLRFRLDRTDTEVRTRCEVRYCLPGVGVGVEFVGISQEASEAIARELELHAPSKREPAKKRRAITVTARRRKTRS